MGRYQLLVLYIRGGRCAESNKACAVYRSITQTQQPQKQLQTNAALNPTNARHLKKLRNIHTTGKALAQQLLSL